MREASQRQKHLAFGGVLVVLFLASLNLTVVGTALPRIIAELEGFDLYAWAFTGFSLASTVTLPIYGRLSDLYGRRPVLLFGIVLFTSASLLCGLATNMGQLVAFRALQGIGGGALISMPWAAIGDIFTARERGRYQGFTGAVFGVSSVVGPIVGGLITDTLGWRWVFFVNVPVALAAWAAVRRYLPRGTQRARSGIDVLGTVLLIAGTVPMLIAFTWAGTVRPWSDPIVLTLLVGSALMLVAFGWWQTRSPHPTLEPALFRDRTFDVANAAAFLTGVGLFGAVIYMPLFIQGVQGGSAAASGFVLAPLMGGVILGSTVTGWLTSRSGRYRRWIAVGVALMVVGFGVTATLGPDTPLAVTVGAMIVLGTGIGPTNSLLVLAVQNALPPHRLGIVTSANQFFRQIGGTIGVTLFGSMVAGHVRGGLPALLPPSARDLPQETLALLTDPNLLTDPPRLAQVRDTLEPMLGGASFDAFVGGLRGLLSTGLSNVFLVALVVSSVALALLIALPRHELADDPAPPAPRDDGASRTSSV